MDVIKMEPDVDPLAVEEANTSLGEGNVTPRHSQTTVVNMDSSYILKREVKIEETSVGVTLPALNRESEDETFGVVKVKDEIKLEEIAEDCEVLSESIFTSDGTESSQVQSDICISTENAASENSTDHQIYVELPREKESPSDKHHDSFICN
ncbi:uncharacterized protein [Periplaneta americana]|uniref:uncharacterized protein isoform X2 n=1 Tax=Periplaneta americana TaxID=6978 RepID=UPI0037E8FB19